mmetsp:Transcript_8960/g.30434  ORF Transcript_8960/g.30434 Transcript_8960/m.30434 type:complete len:277 (+) Transcript_8960:486-1316(+)
MAAPRSGMRPTTWACSRLSSVPAGPLEDASSCRARRRSCQRPSSALASAWSPGACTVETSRAASAVARSWASWARSFSTRFPFPSASALASSSASAASLLSAADSTRARSAAVSRLSSTMRRMEACSQATRSWRASCDVIAAQASSSGVRAWPLAILPSTAARSGAYVPPSALAARRRCAYVCRRASQRAAKASRSSAATSWYSGLSASSTAASAASSSSPPAFAETSGNTWTYLRLRPVSCWCLKARVAPMAAPGSSSKPRALSAWVRPRTRPGS